MRHGGWHAWEQIPAWRREQLIAHELHRSRRDAYYRERVEAHARRNAGKDPNRFSPDHDPLARIKASMGIQY